MRGHHEILMESYAQVTLSLTVQEFDTLLMLARAGHHATRLWPTGGIPSEGAEREDTLMGQLHHVDTNIRAQRHDRVKHEARVLQPDRPAYAQPLVFNEDNLL